MLSVKFYIVGPVFYIIYDWLLIKTIISNNNTMKGVLGNVAKTFTILLNMDHGEFTQINSQNHLFPFSQILNLYPLMLLCPNFQN